MMTYYEAEAHTQDYRKKRLQQAEAERLVRQANPRRSPIEFRLSRFIVKWIWLKTAAKQLQECPEIVSSQ